MQVCENPESLPINPAQISDQDFAEGYKKGFTRTAKFICSLGANPEIAEEISQAAWTRGWQHRHQLQQPQYLSSWVNTIARHLYHEHFAKARRFSELEDRSVDSNILQKLEVQGLMAECSPSEVTFLKMFYFEGYSSDEIAVSLDKSPVTVRVRLMRIRQSMRNRSLPTEELGVAA